MSGGVVIFRREQRAGMLLDGIAYDYAEKNKYLKSAHNFENDILVASANIAKRYSSGKNHIAGTTDLALDIFDSTKKIHGMGKRERLLLQIAVLLHDCGKYISMSDVAECSYRIIMATEIIGLSTEERQVIASAVPQSVPERQHCSRKTDRSSYPAHNPRRSHFLRKNCPDILRDQPHDPHHNGRRSYSRW